ncbi:MAG: lysophospholipid acyltransferase family protein [Planctomycetota bacterium]|nr:lysophospholipid acyltransferase family protein [Planctomycetota bacterium]
MNEAAPLNLAPKRQPRNPFWDSRVCALVSALIAILNVLPGRVARWCGRTAAAMAWLLDRKHRQQVLTHMDIAFRGTMPRAEKEALCRRWFEHIGLGLVEFARMRQLTRENVDQLADFTELKKFDELLARGKGLLCVPAHHGNWELCGYAVSLKGYPLQSVARPMDNPFLDELITAHRERSGNTIIQKWKVLWKLKKLLDKGGIVTMSIDQNGGVAGLFVPCFSTLASTVTSPAELHLATRVPIIVATLNRKPDKIHHVLRVWDVIEYPSSGDHDADVKAVITRINAAVERAVREYPEQWLWVHKRWKTRPPGEAPGPDGLPPEVKIAKIGVDKEGNGG